MVEGKVVYKSDHICLIRTMLILFYVFERLCRNEMPKELLVIFKAFKTVFLS